MDFHIRRASMSDTGAVALIAGATFFETFADVVPREPMLAHCEGTLGRAGIAAWMEEPRTDVWLAELENGTPIGYAGLSAPDLPAEIEVGPADIELKRIYVLASYLHVPVGSALMRTVLDAAQASAVRRMYLGVYATNDRARAFYAKHGFADVGVKPHAVGGKMYELVVMMLAFA